MSLMEGVDDLADQFGDFDLDGFGFEGDLVTIKTFVPPLPSPSGFEDMLSSLYLFVHLILRPYFHIERTLFPRPLFHIFSPSLPVTLPRIPFSFYIYNSSFCTLTFSLQRATALGLRDLSPFPSFCHGGLGSPQRTISTPFKPIGTTRPLPCSFSFISSFLHSLHPPFA